ncbi:MAG: hypothetical protein MZV63_07205 [Marinilabiliales bacterium]|nr:hypothetical protein [Marinilabiliales bacterium]
MSEVRRIYADFFTGLSEHNWRKPVQGLAQRVEPARNRRPPLRPEWSWVAKYPGGPARRSLHLPWLEKIVTNLMTSTGKELTHT